LRLVEVFLQFFDRLALSLQLQTVHNAGLQIRHWRDWFPHSAASILLILKTGNGREQHDYFSGGRRAGRVESISLGASVRIAFGSIKAYSRAEKPNRLIGGNQAYSFAIEQFNHSTREVPPMTSTMTPEDLINELCHNVVRTRDEAELEVALAKLQSAMQEHREYLESVGADYLLSLPLAIRRRLHKLHETIAA